MELLTKSEVETIVTKSGYTHFEDLQWTIDNYSRELIGYLGEHLKLIVKVKSKGGISELDLFLKCMPRFDKWKAKYIEETNFFRKEYAMLNGLFKHFQDNRGERKWRPNLLYIKENLFVFENVSKVGYLMPNHLYTLTDEEVMATVETIARFHAQSYIYEEIKTWEFNRPYRIYEEFGEYLDEPIKGQSWRDTGKKAVVDYLKQYSAYKMKPGFCKDIEIVITKLFDIAVNLMKPSTANRNVVIHRDIWTNNIFFKKLDSGKLHALIVDFQTVLYCCPMLDLSSFLFFNTTKNFRNTQTHKIIDAYYAVLDKELKHNGLDVHTIIDIDKLRIAYEDSIVFGITQAALIIPITTMSNKRREEIYGNYENAVKINCISRSEEFIETAREDINYRNRVTELLDDIVERFVYPLSTVNYFVKMSSISCDHHNIFITEEDVKKIVGNFGYSEDVDIDNYCVHKASDKMLGFLADYYKLKVFLTSITDQKEALCFFIKAVSQNASKADMVREMKLFNKEINFYAIIKRNIEIPNLKSWSAKFIINLNEAIVFEDLNTLGYNTQNKFETFDDAHTQQALNMLARFHASSIIYEQKKRKLLQRPYTINEEFEDYLDKGGYDSKVWFIQCMKGALAAIRSFSRYKDDAQIINIIERRWEEIWKSGLDLSNVLPDNCNVICHRDLWNNNILFHYKQTDEGLIPDDCVLVDFQAVRCQPPAGDVMLLLYCNLEPKFREQNISRFLRHYHQALELILEKHDININDVLSLESFLKSADKQRLWGLIVSACLVPQFWIDDNLTTDIFCNSENFDDILSRDKASFIKRMIETNIQYRDKVIQIFEELVDRYCMY